MYLPIQHLLFSIFGYTYSMAKVKTQQKREASGLQCFHWRKEYSLLNTAM